MIVFRRATQKPPGAGEWVPVILDDKRQAVIGCPKCGRSGYLDHDIATDGTITPSIVCPFDGCDFHEMGQLAGWLESV